MIPGGGKRKGAKLEIQIYREIKALQIQIRRCIGSGASKDEKADLYTTNYIIECKHHKTLTESQLSSFWSKLLVEASMMQKTPVIIYKLNYQPIKAILMLENIKATITYEDFLTYLQAHEIHERRQ